MDESGDAGFKFGKGSSDFFIIAAVVFEDDLEMEKTSIAIKTLKRRLGFQDFREFKFHKLSREIRLEFLKEIKRFQFKILCLVVDKRKPENGVFRDNRSLFYVHAIKMLAKDIDISTLGVKIKLDGGGNRSFKRNFYSHLKEKLNWKDKKIMRDLRFVDSKNNSLIQLADMIAGALRRSYEGNKNDKDIYRNIVKKHVKAELCM